MPRKADPDKIKNLIETPSIKETVAKIKKDTAADKRKTKIIEEDEPASGIDIEQLVNPKRSPTEMLRDDLRRDTRNGRFYVWPPNSANQYISVTNAIGSLPKPALPRWAAKLVAEAAVHDHETWKKLAEDDPDGAIDWLKKRPWSARDKAAEGGSAVHEIAELDAEGRTEDADQIMAGLGEEMRDKALAMRDFFKVVQPKILHSEVVVYSFEYGYAGTLDFVLEIDPAANEVSRELVKRWPLWATEETPIRLLVDLKTGKGVYEDVALQLAAYRYADHMVDIRTGELLDIFEVDGVGVLHTPNKEWSLVPMAGDEDTFSLFLRALALSKDLPLDPNLAGSPILRGKA